MLFRSTAGDEANAYASLDRVFSAPGEGKLAVFARVGFDENSPAVTLYGTGQVGATQYIFAIRYDVVAQELSYRDAASNYQVIGSSLILGMAAFDWYPFLLVVDLATGYYVRAIVNNTEYDLSAYTMESGVSGTAPTGEVLVWSSAVGAAGGTFYVDDIIVVKNVP